MRVLGSNDFFASIPVPLPGSLLVYQVPEKVFTIFKAETFWKAGEDAKWLASCGVVTMEMPRAL